MPLALDDPITRITEAIIGAAIQVHRELGPGLLESAYQACLAYELVQRNVRFTRQVPLPVTYRGIKIDCGYRLDFLVDDLVVVEIKSVEKLAPIHSAQLITYLKLMKCPVGLLLNFNVTAISRGIRRLENRHGIYTRTPNRDLEIDEKDHEK
jgi:GxxExxY protein